MPLEIHTFLLGPLQNNSYLIADPETSDAAVIDPSFDSHLILADANQHGWRIGKIWLTHAHFDHLAGVKTLVDAYTPPLPVGLHPADLDLWHADGGAVEFGIRVQPGPEPSIRYYPGQTLTVGSHKLIVRFTPGHTRGHVIFYSEEAQVAFTGDLIFFEGMGRTDLPGGDYPTLIRSIRTQILTLPPATHTSNKNRPP
jgi:hydroxyacylglutathione hydrolase